MQRRFVPAALVLAICTPGAGVAAAELPYLSLGLGSAPTLDTAAGADAVVDRLRGEGAVVAGGVQTKEEQDAWLVGFGWPTGDHLALELTYADLGRNRYRLQVNGSPASGDTETRAAALTAVPDWAYGPVRLIGRVGLAYWIRQTDVNASGIRLTETAYGAGPVAGGGLELDLGRRGYRWRLRVEWDRYFSVGDDDRTGETDVDLLTAGVVIAR